MMTYADVPSCMYTVFPTGEYDKNGKEIVAFLKTGWKIPFEGGVLVTVHRRWLKNKGADRIKGMYARNALGKRIELPHVIRITYDHKVMLRYSGNVWRDAWMEQGEYTYAYVEATRPKFFQLIVKAVGLAEMIAEQKRQMGGGGGKSQPMEVQEEALPESEEECRNWMELKEFRQRRSRERQAALNNSGATPHYPYADPVLETLSRKAVKENPDFMTEEGRQQIETNYHNWQAQTQRRLAQLEGLLR